jgi:hypothetical protein
VKDVAKFCFAKQADDLQLQVKALRWLRAEYDSTAAAKKELGLSRIVEDADFLSHLKLLARFCRLAGFQGLLVLLDEASVWTQNLHTSVRQANYAIVLNAINERRRDLSAGLGFVLAGTPDFLDARQQGLRSFPAMDSRLSGASAFGKAGQDQRGPILNLEPFRPAENVIILRNARDLVMEPTTAQTRLPTEALVALVGCCMRKLGADQFLTPRELLKNFAFLVEELEANPTVTWQQALGVAVKKVQDEADGAFASCPKLKGLKLK